MQMKDFVSVHSLSEKAEEYVSRPHLGNVGRFGSPASQRDHLDAHNYHIKRTISISKRYR